jgi:DNA-binding NarL/FixJ family response regulator
MRTGGTRASAEARAEAALGQLTARERDVLRCLARGLSNRAIAEDLGIAERTARTHVSNILSKLGLTSRTQAALFAVEHRLDPDR